MRGVKGCPGEPPGEGLGADAGKLGAGAEFALRTKHGSPQVIDITIIGQETPAGIAFVKYTLSPEGPDPVQGRQVLVASTEGIRVGKLGALSDLE